MELAIHTQRNFAEVKHPNETVAESPALYLECQGITRPAHTDMPLRRDTQALHIIARILLIQRREKYPSREEKSAFSQQFSSVYVHSLKDQARQSKYPRTQILGPHTQPKLICYSSITFIPTQSNNLIEVTSQSYIGISPELYSILHHPIQLYPRIHIPMNSCIWDHCASVPLHYSHLRPSKIGGVRLRSSKGKYVKKQHSHRHRLNFLT